MDEAIGEVSRLCKLEDAASALYLVSAPVQEINLDLIKELGNYLKKAARKAIIRSGDYPVGHGIMEVTVILSQLSDVARVRDFYTRSVAPDDEEGPPPEVDHALPADGTEPAPDSPQ
jgi:hypothetical protein